MAEPLHFTAIDHFSITAANQQRQLDFYSRVFGANLRKERDSERYYVKLGSGYLALGQAAQGRRSGFIDHFCVGWEGAWLKPIEDHLTEVGAKYTKPQPFGIFFADPDGIRIQLWTEDSWLDVARTAPLFDHAAPPPLFEAVRIFGLNIELPDTVKATPYYEKLFGPSKNGVLTIGKSVLVLKNAMNQPGIELAVIVVAKVSEGDSDKLKALGATVDTVEPRKWIAFRDPEGARILLVADSATSMLPA